MEENKENKQRRNKKVKQKGNGQGTLYFSEALNCWVGQYVDTTGKRKTMKQKKNEKVGDFKTRFNNTLASIDNGTYIGKSKETVITLATKYVKQKYLDELTSPRSYRRDLETIEQIKKTCSNFCNLPIQNVKLEYIQKAKLEMKKYSNSVIDKIWIMLNAVFKIACSASQKILIYNLMQDVTLVKPISYTPTKKIKPLKDDEFKRLISILDNEVKQHKYRNAVRMQTITAMRIGEVLSRSKNDYEIEKHTFNIHDTLTQDENYHVILGEHTKTFNKKTQIDEGQRYLPLSNSLFKELLPILKEVLANKITNIHSLIFWDYEKNFFITPGEIDCWLKRLNAKYKICNDELSSHRIRHTTLNIWDKVYHIPMPVIQYLAGHVEGSTVTKESYLYTSFDYVEKTLKENLS